MGPPRGGPSEFLVAQMLVNNFYEELYMQFDSASYSAKSTIIQNHLYVGVLSHVASKTYKKCSMIKQVIVGLKDNFNL